MLLEPDNGHRGIERIKLGDLGLLAIFVVFCVFDGQTRGVDVIVKRLAIDAGDTHKAAEADGDRLRPIPQST